MRKPTERRDIAGQRFGSLVALSINEDLSQRGKTVWHCVCDCGNETDVLIHSLTSGNTKSCGRHPRPTKDISGKRFGKLTALCATGEKKNGRTVWRCVCDCGNERDVAITSLGTVKACLQCSQKRAFLDLTGQRFGRLIVLGLGEKDREKKWICQCDCGNTILARTSHLTKGAIVTCGCRRQDPKDIIGEKRGHLTCLAYTGKRDSRGSGIYTWRCDCGNVVERAIMGTADADKNPQCPECQKKVKQKAATTMREKIVRDPETGISVTALKNIIEGKPTARNSSGVRGVHWNRSKGKWEVSGREGGKLIYLGSFDTLEEAKAVREAHVWRVYGGGDEQK